MQLSFLFCQFAICFFVCNCVAQQRAGNIPAKPVSHDGVARSVADPISPVSNYVLGPNDQITLFVSDAEEMNGKAIRIDMEGDISLPLVGRVHAAGLTSNQLEQDIGYRLKRLLRNPQVIVSITDFRSQPVTVLGAVTLPGVHQLQGYRTLFEVLSLAGGLREDAGNTVKITRSSKWGRIPLPGAQEDADEQFSVASVSVKSIMSASNPIENIAIKPDDVISVPKADLVYVVGAVHKPGGFVLGQNESLSALQVVSLAEGFDRTAAPNKAKIMRSMPGSSTRSEIPLDLKKLLAGKAEDFRLRADDILFVPNSGAKSAGIRAVEAAIQTGSGIAIYSRY